MDFVYLPCVTRLKSAPALFTDNGTEAPVHFDLYKGQYVNPELHQPYPKPAIFFRFEIDWEDLKNNTQKGLAIMELHLERENYSETADGSPDQETALKDFEFMRIVNFLIHGFSTADFSPLKRRKTNMDENPVTTNVTIQRYEFELIDLSTDKYKNWLIAKLDDLTLDRKPLPNPAEPNDDDKYHV
jgi:hypothetical protein